MSDKKSLFKSIVSFFSGDDKKELRAMLDENDSEQGSDKPVNATSVVSEKTSDTEKVSNVVALDEERKKRILAEEKVRLAEIQGFRVQAASFTQNLILSDVLYPCENQRPEGKEDDETELGAFESFYLQAATDDRDHPLESGSRVQQLKTLVEVRPKHGLTTDKFDAKRHKALVSQIPDGDDESVTEERLTELRNKTPWGRSVNARIAREQRASTSV